MSDSEIPEAIIQRAGSPVRTSLALCRAHYDEVVREVHDAGLGDRVIADAREATEAANRGYPDPVYAAYHLIVRNVVAVVGLMVAHAIAGCPLCYLVNGCPCGLPDDQCRYRTWPRQAVADVASRPRREVS